jgi:hypothetical protein
MGLSNRGRRWERRPFGVPSVVFSVVVRVFSFGKVTFDAAGESILQTGASTVFYRSPRRLVAKATMK